MTEKPAKQSTEGIDHDREEKKALKATQAQLKVASKVWFVVYVVVFLILAPYIYYSHQINLYGVTNQPAGFNFPTYRKDVPLAALFTGLYFGLNRFVKMLSKPFFAPIVKGQNEPAARERYAEKCAESVAKIAIYAVHFVWGYMTLYKTDWVPWYLFGNGTFEASVANLPFTPCPPEVHLLCLSFLGGFLAYFFEILTQTDRPDFNENFAHHITTVALTAGMIISNNRAIGVVVAWQQTPIDLLVSVCRIFSSMTFKLPMVISYSVMMVIWFWTRIFNFGYITYQIANYMVYSEGLEHFNIHPRIYAVFLFIIFMLQIYWTVLLSQMLMSFCKTGVYTDLARQVKQKEN